MNSFFTKRHPIYGSGRVITELRPVSGFDSVDINPIGTLHVNQGSEEKLYVKAEDNLIRFCETRVVDGT